jgi:Transmembrane family 220, helix
MPIKIGLAALSIFLAFAAYVNLNDPDAALWSTAYGASAVLCMATAVMSKSSPLLQQVAWFGTTAALGLSAYSFAQLDSLQTSGSSGVFGIFELEPIREGGGALIMAIALHLSASQADPTSKSASTSSTGSSVLAVAVAVAGIALGVYLPAYYKNLGVAIPAHCGGEE